MAKGLSFRRDPRGSVAVTSAILMSVVVGVAAISVDVGKIFVDRRKAQNAADMAAIAAVSDLTNADKAASSTINRNNVADHSYELALGVYTPDASLPASQRFKLAGAGSANAAQVTLHTTTPLYFGRVLIGRDKFDIKTTATATRTGFATFAIGSRLLSVNGGLLNQILGGLLGTNLSLSAMDYQALLNTQIDLFGFADALATRLQLTGATYSSVLNSNARVTDVLGAMVDTGKQQYGGQNASVRALTSLLDSVGQSSTRISVGSLLDLGPYDSLTVGQHPKVGASVSTLDIASATAQLANGQHQVEVGLNLNIPGIASAALKVAVGERPRGTSWVTVGAQGASVYTAQTRILLTVGLAGTPPASVVNVPIYIDIASGRATLSALSCGFPDVSTSSITLAVTPGVVDAWIADVSNAQFTNFTAPPNPGAGTLVNLGGLQVTGRAHVSVANMSATPVTFSYSDIQRQTRKTVSTRDFTTSLLTRLFGDLQLSVAGLSLGGNVVAGLVSSTLSTATTPIDQALSTVLSTLGVGLGQADVWVTNIRCDGAVLVL